MLWGESASSEIKQFDIDLWIKQAEKILDDDFTQAMINIEGEHEASPIFTDFNYLFLSPPPLN
ncbi:9289_t:CDS:2 [Entrophospora sp. SA101]|nr:9289_t:CDS:2 [Entrophospora sp. SA101]CAJ0922023.1 17912_t:CDS:2 [Entrophospora sp. SA101]